MTQVIVGDLRTGRRWQNIPYLTCSWEQRRNQPERLSATVSLTDRTVQSLDLRNTVTEGKTYLAIVEGETIPGAGPMLKPEYDQDAGRLTLTAFGIGSALQARTIQRPAAYTIDPALFVVPDPDPENPNGTIPNPALRTSLSNLELGSIIRGWIAQAMSIPGGDLPIVLPPAVAGVHERNVDGVELKNLWDAIADITQVEGGPDVAFPARWITSRLGIEWALRTGTQAQPRLRSETTHLWDLSVPNRSTRKLTISGDASSMGSVAWFTGGRSADVALVERATDTSLTDYGFPLRELVDTSRTNVSIRETLSSYAREAVALGRYSSRFWSFEVRKDLTPMFGQYQVGDRVRLKVRNDLYIPDSSDYGYVREIAGISGDDGLWVKITTSEAFDG